MTDYLPRCGTPEGWTLCSPWTHAGKDRKRNRYATMCSVCGRRLAPNQGAIERKKDGGWFTRCLDIPELRSTNRPNPVGDSRIDWADFWKDHE